MKKNSEKKNSDAARNEMAGHARSLEEIVKDGAERVKKGLKDLETIANAPDEKLAEVLKEIQEKDTKAQKK